MITCLGFAVKCSAVFLPFDNICWVMVVVRSIRGKTVLSPLYSVLPQLYTTAVASLHVLDLGFCICFSFLRWLWVGCSWVSGNTSIRNELNTSPHTRSVCREGPDVCEFVKHLQSRLNAGFHVLVVYLVATVCFRYYLLTLLTRTLSLMWLVTHEGCAWPDALCELQGCKNRPAPFPGQMYKATKPGSICPVS